MTKSEAKIMKEVRIFLTKNGIYWSNLPAGSPGHKKGDPDTIACINGRYVAMEGKKRTGQQSARQKEVGQLIRDSGGIYAIIRSIDDVKDIIRSIEKE